MGFTGGTGGKEKKQACKLFLAIGVWGMKRMNTFERFFPGFLVPGVISY